MKQVLDNNKSLLFTSLRHSHYKIKKAGTTCLGWMLTQLGKHWFQMVLDVRNHSMAPSEFSFSKQHSLAPCLVLLSKTEEHDHSKKQKNKQTKATIKITTTKENTVKLLEQHIKLPIHDQLWLLWNYAICNIARMFHQIHPGLMASMSHIRIFLSLWYTIFF